MKHIDPYLSAIKLGINDETREALIWLAGELMLNRIPHDQNYNPHDAIREAVLGVARPLLTSFNMAVVRCGTVGCIRGWLESIGPLSVDELLALDDLFYPNPGLHDHRSITPERAGREIMWWLSTGHAWGK